MSGWLGKFANLLIKVERFAASIRYWTETGSKGQAKLNSWPSGSTRWKKRSPHSASRGTVAGSYPERAFVKYVNIGDVEDDPTPPGPASFSRLGDEVEVTYPCSKAGE